MKSKRALEREQNIAAITHGKEPERKLPVEIKLARSQSLSLIALNTDEQRLRKQLQDVNEALQATIRARVEVLGEIGTAHGVSVQEISNNYQFDGSNLILPRG